MKYEIEDFDDFLLSEDFEAKRLGWIMVRKSINPSKLTLDELFYLRIKLEKLQYFGYLIPERTFFKISIEKSISRYSKMARINANYRAQKLIKNDSKVSNK